MHKISQYEPEYCAACGEILSTDGFCMRCSGTELEELEAETLAPNNNEEELDFNREDSPEYIPDTITTDTLGNFESDDGQDESPDDLSDLYGREF